MTEQYIYAYIVKNLNPGICRARRNECIKSK